jgi:8-oxo-dGTP pyrophosphatase MutT (NUDIX family)
MNFTDNNRIQQCTNCGIIGHVFRNCMSPVTSYGIIAIRYTSDVYNNSLFSKNTMLNNGYNSINFLLIQRKDSLSYVEFIRGKYNVNDDEYIAKLMRNMTKKEQTILKECNFDKLWKSVWGDNSTVKCHKNDYELSEKKFNEIISKIPLILCENESIWDEPEWGFPKGRRNPHETDITCAIREFQEETGLKRNDFTIIQNVNPISETFFGSNHVHYCHKYYIALCDNNIEVKILHDNLHMAREIGAIKWCTLDEAITKIRPDNVEKREILLKAGKIMKNFHPVYTNDMHKSLSRKNIIKY